MGLIEDAILEVRNAREERSKHDFGINSPSTPKAWREAFYLQLREDIYAGIRVVDKRIPDPMQRSSVNQILVQALVDIFQYGKTETSTKPYEDMLDILIGHH